MRHLFSVLIVGVLTLGFSLAQEAKKPSSLNQFLDKHCIDCHDSSLAEGELDLTSVSRDLNDPEVYGLWIRIHDRIENGEMPPAKKPRPESGELVGVLESLSSALGSASISQNEVVLRRMNRDEYENTVRDLFGIRAEVKEILPEDAKSHGFATIGDALGVSTELMHAYLDAADVVLKEVFGSSRPPKKIDYSYKPGGGNTPEGKHFRNDPEGLIMFNIPSNGKIRVAKGGLADKGTYRVRVTARGVQSDHPVGMRVTAGDINVKRRPFWLQGLYSVPVEELTTFEFEEFLYPGDGIELEVYGELAAGSKYNMTPNPGILVNEVTIEGPLEPWPPPVREALLQGVDPEQGTIADIQKILGRLLPRAFRRPVPPAELAVYVGLATQVLAEGRTFTDALSVSVKGILSSPSFLFLEEPLSAKAPGRINEYALASRLSYFLWSTTPDEILLRAAASGKLLTPDGLRAETERLLNDPKAEAFTRNFLDQWLKLAEFDATSPDTKLYPEYDSGLRQAMLAETTLFFNEVIRNNLSVMEFIESDWTFLNKRLAHHYNIPGVEGYEMRKVKLPEGSSRGGLLTQASLLKTTANGTNTSPVVRGIWVLESILGKTPPPPPPAVPAIEPDSRGATTIRELLVKHRESKACNSCHSQIDPPGFALEAFDVIGGERDWYRVISESAPRVNQTTSAGGSVRVAYRKGPEVDASGVLPNGQSFNDVRDFKKIIAANPEQIAKSLAEKMLTYGTGRVMSFADRATIDAVAAKTRSQKFGFRSLVHEVVQCEIFHRP